MKPPHLIVLAMLAESVLPDMSTVIQFGALGILAWYFLKIEPKNRREERAARLNELRMLIDALNRKKGE